MVDFVGNKQNFLFGLAQHAGNFFVEVGEAGSDIHHEQNHIRFINSQHYLLANLIFEYVF